MRILVVEPLHPVFDRLMRMCGAEIVHAEGVDRSRLAEMVSDFDVVVVRGRTIIDREILERGARGRLRVVARAGVGLDNIDLETARRLGIEVVNAPTASSRSVAELTIGLMIAAARRIAELDRLVKEGEWRRPLGIELWGKTLLIVGFGRIGKLVARVAKAMDMRVLAYDKRDIYDEARKLGVEVVDTLEKGLSRADVVSLHVPLTPETRNLMNEERFRSLKPGAILVNTSRGPVIDARALLKALDEWIVAAAGLDVLPEEPPRSPEVVALARHPRVVVTPHIGASTVEAQQRVAIEIATAIARALNAPCRPCLEGVAEACLSS